MLTGKRAWTGDSAGAVAVARLSGDPPAPSSLRSGIPQILDIAVRRALARVPADRPTAGDMAALLGRYIADPQGAVPPPPRPAVAAAAATGAAIGAASAAGTPGASAAPGTAAALGAPTPGQPAASPQGVFYGDPRAIAAAGRGGPPGTPYAQPYSDDEEEDRGAGAWAWVAAILGVLVLFAGGVLLFLLLSGRPGGTTLPTGLVVQVPSFVGLPLADARGTPRRKGLCSASAPIR